MESDDPMKRPDVNRNKEEHRCLSYCWMAVIGKAYALLLGNAAKFSLTRPYLVYVLQRIHLEVQFPVMILSSTPQKDINQGSSSKRDPADFCCQAIGSNTAI